MNVFRIELEDHSKTMELLDKLLLNSKVLFAELEPIKTYDTTFSSSTNVRWHHTRIQTPEAWSIQTGSPDVKIGVVDSGVKWNHPDLSGRIWIDQSYYSTNPINWTNGTISGQFGSFGINENAVYWGDVMGWNFFENNNNPFQTGNGNPHGTIVAGVAVASGTATGIAYTSKLISTKHSPFNNNPSAGISNAYAGVYYLVNKGVRIIVCSWGHDSFNNAGNLAVSYARAHGSLVIATAGNRLPESNLNTHGWETPRYPANFDDVIAVAATDLNDRR